MAELLVDPAVSREKFARQVSDYRKMEADHRRRGWFLLSAEFPKIEVAFVGAHLQPPALLLGVVLDFTNYDLWPPSVRLVNPLTWEPYRARELPFQLLQFNPAPQIQLPPGVQLPGGPPLIPQPVMIWYRPDDVPFLCLQGVREYHQQPSHSGDYWLLRRLKGEGTLFNILEKIFMYGVRQLRVQHGISVQFRGYGAEAPPV